MGNLQYDSSKVSILRDRLDAFFKRKYSHVNYEITIKSLLRKYMIFENIAYGDLVVNLPDLHKIIVIEIIDDIKFSPCNEIAKKLENVNLDVIFINNDSISSEQSNSELIPAIINRLHGDIPDRKYWNENLDIYILNYLQVEQYLDEVLNSNKFVDNYNKYKEFLKVEKIEFQEINIDESLLVVDEDERIYKRLLCLYPYTKNEEYYIFLQVRLGSLTDYRSFKKIVESMRKYDRDTNLMVIYDSEFIRPALENFNILDLNILITSIENFKGYLPH